VRIKEVLKNGLNNLKRNNMEQIIEKIKEEIEILNQIILIKDEIIENIQEQNYFYKNHIQELTKIIGDYKLLIDDSIYKLKNNIK
jgi:hypothetical protein